MRYVLIILFESIRGMTSQQLGPYESKERCEIIGATVSAASRNFHTQMNLSANYVCVGAGE
jgi:hypothetical protein